MKTTATIKVAMAFVATFLVVMQPIMSAYALITKEEAEQNFRNAIADVLREGFSTMFQEPAKNETIAKMQEAAINYYAFLPRDEVAKIMEQLHAITEQQKQQEEAERVQTESDYAQCMQDYNDKVSCDYLVKGIEIPSNYTAAPAAPLDNLGQMLGFGNTTTITTQHENPLQQLQDTLNLSNSAVVNTLNLSNSDGKTFFERTINK